LAGGERKGSFPLGKIAGFDLTATVYRDREETSFGFHLDGIPTGTKLVSRKQMSGDAPLGMILQIEHLAENLVGRAEGAERDATAARRDTDQARERLGRPFEHTERIGTLSAKLEQIDITLASDEPSLAATPPSPTDHQSSDERRTEVEPEAWYDDARRLHREDGPAYIAVDKSREWWVHGERHRDDGPAIEAADGTREWYRRGELHRRGGPAIVGGDGHQQWFHHGVRQPRPQPTVPTSPEPNLPTPAPVEIDL
jgi:hypothetical protein